METVVEMDRNRQDTQEGIGGVRRAERSGINDKGEPRQVPRSKIGRRGSGDNRRRIYEAVMSRGGIVP